MLGGPGVYTGRQSLHLPFWALRPKPRPTFSRRESRQRYARDLLVPGPPAQGGGPPWIPPPSALAVLVEGGTESAASSGAVRQSGLPIPFLLSSKKLLQARWAVQAVHSRAGRLGGRSGAPMRGMGTGNGNKGTNISFCYISISIYIFYK